MVTGASGFVGSAVVNELHNAGKYEICGIIGRRKSTDNTDLSGKIKILRADISVYKTLENLEELKDTSVIVHTAGLAHQFGRVTKEDFWRDNVHGTGNICRLAGEIGAAHFILISSVAVYGDYGYSEIDETLDCHPFGFYAESKFESEKKAIEFCERHKIRLTILRLATVIGEGDRGNTTRLIRAIEKGRFVWIGAGSNKKSLIYKNDVAEGILKIIESDEKNGTEIYNLIGESVTMREIVGLISKNLHKKTPRLKISEGLVRGFFKVTKKGFSIAYINKFEKTFDKWLSNDIFSGRKFLEKYGFKPKTSISDALKKQVNYYLDQKNKK